MSVMTLISDDELHLVAERGVEAQAPAEAGHGLRVAVISLHHHPAVTGAHGGRTVPVAPSGVVRGGDWHLTRGYISGQ